ncbi:hypothetical protein BESB_036100 [Besnoitia besnoiti]|uniref:Leucine rich repeat protein n=1 Tax=Besnoitia besnoiti TaxID=94643 RepID=A0A2A9MNC9_BESBE|nr:hypothetical protein BESB_036100 [Besnoitia besnoiti]PFH37152.1 hypothetical protein BESB_036100 [Besnoitia besnoiti]
MARGGTTTVAGGVVSAPVSSTSVDSSLSASLSSSSLSTTASLPAASRAGSRTPALLAGSPALASGTSLCSAPACASSSPPSSSSGSAVTMATPARWAGLVATTRGGDKDDRDIKWENFVELDNAAKRLAILLDWKENKANGYHMSVLDDARLEAFSQWLDTYLTQQNATGLTRSEIFLSNNRITHAGLDNLLTTLTRHKVGCRIMKLYRNNISDPGMASLSRYITAIREPLHELHLSHNKITARGAATLLRAVAAHPGYPRVGRKGKLVPLWLRLEQNEITQVNKLMVFIHSKGVAFCTEKNRDLCGPSKCRHATATWSPLVHLYVIDHQTHELGGSGLLMAEGAAPLPTLSGSSAWAGSGRAEDKPEAPRGEEAAAQQEGAAKRKTSAAADQSPRKNCWATRSEALLLCGSAKGLEGKRAADDAKRAGGEAEEDKPTDSEGESEGSRTSRQAIEASRWRGTQPRRAEPRGAKEDKSLPALDASDHTSWPDIRSSGGLRTAQPLQRDEDSSPTQAPALDARKDSDDQAAGGAPSAAGAGDEAPLGGDASGRRRKSSSSAAAAGAEAEPRAAAQGREERREAIASSICGTPSLSTTTAPSTAGEDASGGVAGAACAFDPQMFPAQSFASLSSSSASLGSLASLPAAARLPQGSLAGATSSKGEEEADRQMERRKAEAAEIGGEPSHGRRPSASSWSARGGEHAAGGLLSAAKPASAATSPGTRLEGEDRVKEDFPFAPFSSSSAPQAPASLAFRASHAVRGEDEWRRGWESCDPPAESARGGERPQAHAREAGAFSGLAPPPVYDHMHGDADAKRTLSPYARGGASAASERRALLPAPGDAGALRARDRERDRDGWEDFPPGGLPSLAYGAGGREKGERAEGALACGDEKTVRRTEAKDKARTDALTSAAAGGLYAPGDNKENVGAWTNLEAHRSAARAYGRAAEEGGEGAGGRGAEAASAPHFGAQQREAGAFYAAYPLEPPGLESTLAGAGGRRRATTRGEGAYPPHAPDAKAKEVDERRTHDHPGPYGACAPAPAAYPAVAHTNVYSATSYRPGAARGGDYYAKDGGCEESRRWRERERESERRDTRLPSADIFAALPPETQRAAAAAFAAQLAARRNDVERAGGRVEEELSKIEADVARDVFLSILAQPPPSASAAGEAERSEIHATRDDSRGERTTELDAASVQHGGAPASSSHAAFGQRHPAAFVSVAACEESRRWTTGGAYYEGPRKREEKSEKTDPFVPFFSSGGGRDGPKPGDGGRQGEGDPLPSLSALLTPGRPAPPQADAFYTSSGEARDSRDCLKTDAKQAADVHEDRAKAYAAVHGAQNSYEGPSPAFGGAKGAAEDDARASVEGAGGGFAYSGSGLACEAAARREEVEKGVVGVQRVEFSLAAAEGRCNTNNSTGCSGCCYTSSSPHDCAHPVPSSFAGGTFPAFPPSAAFAHAGVVAVPHSRYGAGSQAASLALAGRGGPDEEKDCRVSAAEDRGAFSPVIQPNSVSTRGGPRAPPELPCGFSFAAFSAGERDFYDASRRRTATQGGLKEECEREGAREREAGSYVADRSEEARLLEGAGAQGAAASLPSASSSAFPFSSFSSSPLAAGDSRYPLPLGSVGAQRSQAARMFPDEYRGRGAEDSRAVSDAAARAFLQHGAFLPFSPHILDEKAGPDAAASAPAPALFAAPYGAQREDAEARERERESEREELALMRLLRGKKEVGDRGAGEHEGGQGRAASAGGSYESPLLQDLLFSSFAAPDAEAGRKGPGGRARESAEANRGALHRQFGQTHAGKDLREDEKREEMQFAALEAASTYPPLQERPLLGAAYARGGGYGARDCAGEGAEGRGCASPLHPPSFSPSFSAVPPGWGTAKDCAEEVFAPPSSFFSHRDKHAREHANFHGEERLYIHQDGRAQKPDKEASFFAPHGAGGQELRS